MFEIDDRIERLVSWVVAGPGTPGTVPTRYAGEIELPEHSEAADVRIAIRKAFADGMAFNDALADAADHWQRA
jgi:hypothetical protein